MRWAVRSWRVCVGMVLVAVALGSIVWCEVSPTRVLLARWNKFVVVAPRGIVMVRWGLRPPVGNYLSIYDMGSAAIITTHATDGTAMFQILPTPGRDLSRLTVQAGTQHKTSIVPSGGFYLMFGVIWAAAPMLLVGSWLLLRAWKRRPRGVGCAGCGYSREGLAVGAACPECGNRAAGGASA